MPLLRFLSNAGELTAENEDGYLALISQMPFTLHAKLFLWPKSHRGLRYRALKLMSSRGKKDGFGANARRASTDFPKWLLKGKRKSEVYSYITRR